MSKAPRAKFTLTDLIAGLTPTYLLGLIDDVKWRDSASKATQYALKLSGACVSEYDLLGDSSKTTAGNFNTAAGLLSTARRVFRFLRWTRFVHDLPVTTADKDPAMRALKTLHFCSGILACIVEDITTLERLRLIETGAPILGTVGNLAWLGEASTGLLITLVLARKQSEAYHAAHKAYRAAMSSGDIDAARGLGAVAFQAYVKLHFTTATVLKWIGEVTAATHDNGYHGATKAALAGSLVSALVSTYSQSAKFWK